jgi:hypothetical protein
VPPAKTGTTTVPLEEVKVKVMVASAGMEEKLKKFDPADCWTPCSGELPVPV